MLRRRRNSLLLANLIVSLAVFTQAAKAAPMSTGEMIVVLREAKVVSPTVRLDVLQSDQHVTVITKRSANMLDRDCKITAVLMAKALMDARPRELAAVKVIYTRDGENTVSKVVVSAGDVQSFAKGTITESQLLGSLELSRESEDGGEAVNPGVSAAATGPQGEKIGILQSRIAALKQGGTGVAPFEKMFNQIEDLTKSGKEKEASLLIGELSTRLAEQESLRDQAKRVAEGRGVKGQQGTSSQSSNMGGNAPGGGKRNDIQGTIAFLKVRIKNLSSAGVATGDMQQRLDYVEQHASTLAPDAAMSLLDSLRNEVGNAQTAQRPNGGIYRKRFNN